MYVFRNHFYINFKLNFLNFLIVELFLLAYRLFLWKFKCFNSNVIHITMEKCYVDAFIKRKL